MRARSVLFLVLTVSPFSLPAAGQSASPDSRTLQAILDEIHTLRQDLQTTSRTVQRAEILLYRVRFQLDVVERVSQRLEFARLRVAEARNEQNHFVGEKKRAEDQLEQTQDPVKRKDFEQEVAAVQSHLEQIKDNEPDAEAREAAISNDLRNEQAKLAELQDQLDRLDKKLEDDRQQQGVQR